MKADRNELILDVATEGFWDWNLKTDRAYLSPRYCELVGYSPDDTVFDSLFFRSIIHPDDRDQVFQIIGEHLQGKRANSVIEYRMVSRNGTIRWIKARGKVVAHDDNGAPLRMVGTIVDISERKRADHKIFSMLSRCPGLAVASFDKALRHKYVSPAIEEIIGLPHEYFIEKTIRELGLPESLADQWEKALNGVWDTGQPEQFEFSYLSPGGERFYLAYLAPEFSSDGSIGQVISITKDITERKRAEETLRASQNLLNKLTVQVPGVLFKTCKTAGGEFRSPYASEKSHDIYELSPEEIGRDMSAIFRRIHPEDLDRFVATVLESGETLALWQCEYRVILPRQGLKWLYGTAQPEALEDGSTVWYGIVVDISERKHAEESLRLSENKFSTVFHTSPNAIMLTRGSDGKLLELNEGFTKFCGFPVAEALGRTSLELNIWVDPADRQRLLEELENKGVVRGMEIPFRRKDGSIFVGQMSVSAIEINGEPCLLTIARDVTEQKQAVLALQNNEKNLQAILDAIPVGMAINDGQAIEYLNSSFVRQFGYASDELPTIEDWYLRAYPDPAYRESLLDAWNSGLEKARNCGVAAPTLEVSITCKDGTVRPTLANTQILEDRILVVFTDITEHEILQKEHLKMQKLESLGVLAGGIAHDFNNILTGIMGNISFAKMLIDSSQDAYEPLDRAEKASLRAADLARQLLVFAKGGQPVKKLLGLGTVVDEATSLVLSGTNVKGVIEMPASLHAVEADEGQINQVFHNIVINAVQAMPGGGILMVRGENVHLDDRARLGLAPGHFVRISFTDEGCGIPEIDQKKIFDPYFTTKPGGTGLGLASAFAIITRHGGHLAVSSSVGIGTTFTIHLPSTGEVCGDQGAGKAALEAGHAGGTVLVMDDEEIVRALATITLVHAGYTVETCENGDEAIAMYCWAKNAGTPFIATIMDLTIPGGMGGAEAARQILAFDPEAVLIVSSGYSADPVMANHRQYGFRAAIEKPYKAQDIFRVITHARGG
jgi:two-component system, cell cycle sensor histidine kinase and response regulator CckA